MEARLGLTRAVGAQVGLELAPLECARRCARRWNVPRPGPELGAEGLPLPTARGQTWAS